MKTKMYVVGGFAFKDENVANDFAKAMLSAKKTESVWKYDNGHSASTYFLGDTTEVSIKETEIHDSKASAESEADDIMMRQKMAKFDSQNPISTDPF